MMRVKDLNVYAAYSFSDENKGGYFITSDYSIVESIFGTIPHTCHIGQELTINNRKVIIREITVDVHSNVLNYSVGTPLGRIGGKEVPYCLKINSYTDFID